MKNLLITGGSGYVGKAFIEKYRHDYNIRAFGRTKVNIDIDSVEGDIKNLNDILKAITDIDVIAHLAAITTDRKDVEDIEFFKTNVLGTLNILEAARENKIKKIVFFSSVCAVGFREDNYPVRETEECHPTDGMYGYSKYIGERLCELYSEKYGIRIIVLRPAVVTPQHEFSLHKSKTGCPWIGFVHIDDVLQALKLAVENENILFDIFHIAPDSRHSIFDISKAKNILGFKPIHNFNEQVTPARIISAKTYPFYCKIKSLFAKIKKGKE